MSQREKQSEFVMMVASLVLHAYQLGYELTYGDTYASKKEVKCPKCKEKFLAPHGHSKNSFHPKRLAVDFNLFKDGIYLTDTEDHRPLGEYWKSIGGTWGGDFKRKDGNHYSLGE